MRHPVLRLYTFLALSVAGCAKTPPQTRPTAVGDDTFAFPAERVWDALLDAYADLKIPTTIIDKASWSVRVDSMRLSSAEAREWTNCASDEDVSLNMATRLVPRGDSTSVHLSVDAARSMFSPNYQSFTGTRRWYASCSIDGPNSSKGVLEQRMIEAIRRFL